MMQTPCSSLSNVQEQIFPELSEERARRHLYHLALANGLGGDGQSVVNSIFSASRGAWQVSARGDGSGINGGGPLEVSARSDSPNTLRFASCVGLPNLSPVDRLQLGIEAFESYLNSHAAEAAADYPSLTPLKQWSQQLDASRGRFGCYLGGAHSTEHARSKLYIDLFSSGDAKMGLHQMQRLVSSCGYSDIGTTSLASLEKLLDIAIPRTLSMEWSREKKGFSFKLYWRFMNGKVSPERVCQMVSANPELATDVKETFRKSSGGFYTRQMPTEGFVHSWPMMDGAVGFYSMAPSRWSGTPKKRETMMQLWREWGGDSNHLDKVWKLAKRPSHLSWVPTLTLLGLAERAGGERTISAYFNPGW